VVCYSLRVPRMITLLLTALVTSAGLTACGGGGGGGSSPPQPSVTISGNAGQYWQDEPIEIRFSVQNMDASTISYAVSNYVEGYDFTLNTSTGVFRTLDYQYTDAGDYSLSVTATDGAGKTASRSFQFSVNAVLTGRIEVQEPAPTSGDAPRRVQVDVSRDGVFSLSLGNTYTDLGGGAFDAQEFACSGEVQVSASLFDGTGRCGGLFPTELNDSGYYFGDNNEPLYAGANYQPVTRIEVSGDINQQAGEIAFYTEDGGLVDTWNTYYNTVSLYEFTNLTYWPSNEQLPGRYVLLQAKAQYKASLAFYPDGRGGVRQLDVLNAPQFDIGNNYAVQAIGDGCAINGQLSDQSIDEYELIYEGTKGDFWQDVVRVMSADYRAIGCDSLPLSVPNDLLVSVGDGPISIDQSTGPAAVSALMFDALNSFENQDVALFLAGSGEDRPFQFVAVKICQPTGESTPINRAFLLSCN